MADLIKKRESNLLPVLIVFIGIVAGWIFYSQVISLQQEPVLPPAAEENGLSVFRRISFDFGIFDTPEFRSLRTFGESPVNLGPRGKENLFAPF